VIYYLSEKSSEELQHVAQLALSHARKQGAEDVSVIIALSNENQVRFANNSITLVNNVREITIDLYLSINKRRIVGSSYNPTESGILRFVENLLSSCRALPESPDYVPLPKGPFSYRPSHANYDRTVRDAPLVEYAKEAINSAISSGAVRASGSINSAVTDLYIVTSGGASAADVSSSVLLNVRAFADDNSSGQGLSCSSYLSDFHADKAGLSAGDFAKKSLNSETISEGEYTIIFSPTVIANILPIASSASAFAVESGNSFLVDKLGNKIGVDALNVEDYGVYTNGLGGRIFDDEGVPTGVNPIVQNGTFTTMLHNSTTAKKFGKDHSTGNAGIISPRATTIIFSGGDSSLEEMIKETKDGLYVTNNWYTRYQNIRSGEYSTVPRDAAFTIKGGEIATPVRGFRLSDSVPRQLSNIELISKDRSWIKWWEVSTPTLTPAMMIKGVRVTRAVGS
jgi:PmbA protein